MKKSPERFRRGLSGGKVKRCLVAYELLLEIFKLLILDWRVRPSARVKIPIPGHFYATA